MQKQNNAQGQGPEWPETFNPTGILGPWDADSLVSFWPSGPELSLTGLPRTALSLMAEGVEAGWGL